MRHSTIFAQRAALVLGSENSSVSLIVLYIELQRSRFREVTDERRQSSPRPTVPKRPTKLVAVYSFEGEQEGDLALKVYRESRCVHLLRQPVLICFARASPFYRRVTSLFSTSKMATGALAAINERVRRGCFQRHTQRRNSRRLHHLESAQAAGYAAASHPHENNARDPSV
jgi:hypothetical protein